MRTEIKALRIPRLVTGIVNRCREVERVAVLDEVPVAVPHADPADAPVAIRAGKAVEIRVIEGLAYQPVAGGGFENAWAELVEKLVPYVAHDAGIGGYVDLDPVGDIQNWGGYLKGAVRKRGIHPAGAVAMREIHDEGRAAQAEAAKAMARRIAMVEDVLMVRTDLPRTNFHVVDGVFVRQKADAMSWRHDDPWGEPFGVDDFRIDRPDEAEAYAETLRRQGMKVMGSMDVFEVVDAGALASCYDRACPEGAMGLVAMGNGFVEAMAYELSEYPEPEIARYLSLRALLRANDGKGIMEWMEGAERTLELARELPAYRHNSDFYKRDAVGRMGRAMARFRGIECPKLDFADAETLAPRA